MAQLTTFCQFLSQGRTKLSKLKNDCNCFPRSTCMFLMDCLMHVELGMLSAGSCSQTHVAMVP